MTLCRSLAGAMCWVCIVANISCDKTPSSGPKEAQVSPVTQASAPVAKPEIPEVRPGNLEHFLLIYSDEGAWKATTDLNSIPEERRAQVVVQDLRISPEERGDQATVWLADLRKVGADERYAVTSVPRAMLDKQVRAQRKATTPPAADVILYRTEWCGVCKKAAAYFRQNQIKFREVDVEADKVGAQELADKARKAGMSISGVPVIDVGGVLIQGFDPGRVASLLKQGN